jgi:hypothetical protein
VDAAAVGELEGLGLDFGDFAGSPELRLRALREALGQDLAQALGREAGVGAAQLAPEIWELDVVAGPVELDQRLDEAEGAVGQVGGVEAPGVDAAGLGVAFDEEEAELGPLGEESEGDQAVLEAGADQGDVESGGVVALARGGGGGWDGRHRRGRAW